MGLSGRTQGPVLQPAVAADLAVEPSSAENDVQADASLREAQGVQARRPAPPEGGATGLGGLIRNAVASSLWPLMLGLDYATLELFSAVGPRFDIARFGSEVLRPSPRQVDVLIVPGVVTHKMAPIISGLQAAMAEPRFVIALGAGAIGGSPFAGSYNVVDDLRDVVPVDVFIPGDPPRPEAIIDGILKLAELIRAGRNVEPETMPRYHPERWPHLYSAMVDAGLEMGDQGV